MAQAPGARPRQRAARAAGRNRQARGDTRRRQILDAAVELFAAKGYRGTGLAALAERVGMTATGLLYYFGSKEQLLRDVVAERERLDHADLPALDTLASLRALGRPNAETGTLVRLYVVLGAENLDPGDPLHEFFTERYEFIRQSVRNLLDTEVAAGEVRADVDTVQVATEILAMRMGLEIQWLADPDRIDLAAAIEAYIDRLVVELAP